MRTPRAWQVALTIALASLAACTTLDGAPSPLIAGRALAERKCSGCHAVDVTGRSRNPQAPPFRDLYKRYPVEGLRPAFTEGIEVAHPMPRFRLNPRQIDNLLEYLKGLNPCARRSSDKGAMARCFAPL